MSASNPATSGGESDYMCIGEGGRVSGVGGYVATCVSFCYSRHIMTLKVVENLTTCVWGGDGFRCGWVRCRLGVVVSQQAHHDSSSGGESDYMCIGEGGRVSGVGGYVAAWVSFCYSRHIVTLQAVENLTTCVWGRGRGTGFGVGGYVAPWVSFCHSRHIMTLQVVENLTTCVWGRGDGFLVWVGTLPLACCSVTAGPS